MEFKNDYDREYYYEVYRPWMDERYADCDDADEELSHDLNDVEMRVLHPERLEKVENKHTRKEVIDELADFETDKMSEKGKAKLRLTPKKYAKKLGGK